MPTSITTQPEFVQQCAAILQVLTDADVPVVPHEAGGVPDVLVAMRPALGALGVSQADQRWFEARQRVEAQDCPWHLVRAPCGWNVIWIPLGALLLVMPHGQHPAHIRFQVWFSGVLVAMMHHGVYEPLTGHCPAPGEELDALERREDLRDLWADAFPQLAHLWGPRQEEDDHD